MDLQPRLRDAAGVPEGVGDPDPVADVARQLVDGVAGLEIGEAEAGQDVGATDDEDAEVHEVEEERLARRERGDQQDHREQEQLQASEHLGCPRGASVPFLAP